MRRSSAFVAAALLFSSLGAVGCSRHDADVGKVQLALAVPGGHAINEISYTVYQFSRVVLGPATIDVSDPNAAPSFDLALPPTLGASITLFAYSTNGHPYFGTSEVFNIVSGQTTLVAITLRDLSATPAPAPGKAIVHSVIVSGDALPVTVSVVVAPRQISVGGSIAVSVAASDPDAGDTLTYLWSTDSPSGIFADARAASTTYTSPQAGTQKLSVTVTDDYGAFIAVADLPVSLIFTPTGPAGPPSALELAERALGDRVDIELLRAGHPEDPLAIDQEDPGWGPATLPAQQQYDAAVALIRRLAALLPNSARNVANTGPYVPGDDVNVLNALLNLNANPLDLFSGVNLAPRAGTALDAYIAGVVADTFAPASPTYLHGLPAGSTDAMFASYISSNSPDPEGVVGLSTNIVKVALLFGLEAELRAF